MANKSILAILITVINFVASLPVNERIALTRDHLAREDPDELFYGYFPAWGAVLFVLAGVFFVLTILAGVCSILGCRNPNQPNASAIAKGAY